VNRESLESSVGSLTELWLVAASILLIDFLINSLVSILNCIYLAGMLGSDMALFTASRPDEIVDAHVVSARFPQTDDCQQDWILVSSHMTSANASDFIMFETRRKLDTEDPQDIVLVRDDSLTFPEQRIIAAWGDSPEVSSHGPNSVARGAFRVFQADVAEPSFDDLMARESSVSFFVGASNYTIPKDGTTYADFCTRRQDMIAQGVPETDDKMSIIGFRPILDAGYSAKFVHHYVVSGSRDVAPSDEECSDAMDLVYVWAPGDGEFVLPEFLGASIFGEDGFQGFNIEIHYDNPELEEGVVDSSGVEFFYSTTVREVELGVLQVGDPFVTLNGHSVGEGYNVHQFDCPSSCSGLYLADGEPVTVLREYLHMHAVGARMTNEQIRNDDVVRTASTEVWEFNANGNIATKQEPYQLLPGDSFRTKCYYNGNSDSVFGLASQEEMCIAFLYYYPRRTFDVQLAEGNFSIPWLCGNGIDWLEGTCSAEYSGGTLEGEDGLNRKFGALKSQCLLDQGTTTTDFDPSPASPPMSEETEPSSVEASSTESTVVESVATSTPSSSAISGRIINLFSVAIMLMVARANFPII